MEKYDTMLFHYKTGRISYLMRLLPLISTFAIIISHPSVRKAFCAIHLNNNMSLKVHDDMFETQKYIQNVPADVIELLPEGEGIKCRSSLFRDFEVGDTVSKPKMSVDTYVINKLEFEMEDGLNHCFPVHSIWKKRDLTDAYRSFGKHNNFGCCWNHNSLNCNFCKPKNKETIRSIKTKCEAGIKIAPLFSAPPDLKSFAQRKKRKILQGESDFVIIIKTCAAHNDHDLSPTEYVASVKRSGDISKSLSPTVIFQLVHLYENQPTLPISTVRFVLESLKCDAISWSANDVSNIRFKIHTVALSMTEVERNDYESFMCCFRNKKLDELFTCEHNEYIDKTSLRARKLAHEVLRSTGLDTKNKEDNGQRQSTIQEFNELLKADDEYFDYYIVKCSVRNIVLAVFWMTGAMRDDFDRYGAYLGVDLCKKEYNSHLMPYISAMIVRDNRSIGPVIEGLVIGDSHDWAKHMIDALIKMASKRTREEILVLSGDGAYSQDTVTNVFFLPNAVFILDRWHLTQAHFIENFPVNRLNTLKPLLMNLVQAESEYDFDNAFEEAKRVLRTLPNYKAKEMLYLQKLHATRKTFANYALRSIPGSFGFIGSSCSEENHASILSHLGKLYFSAPVQMEADLLSRFRLQQYSRMKTLVKENFKLRAEHECLESSKFCGKLKEYLLQASSGIEGYSLSLNGYLRVKSYAFEALQYSKKKLDNGNHEIIRNGFEKGRVFLEGNNERCKCDINIAHRCSCPHDIFRDNFFFSIEHFDPRWVFTPESRKQKRNNYLASSNLDPHLQDQGKDWCKRNGILDIGIGSSEKIDYKAFLVSRSAELNESNDASLANTTATDPKPKEIVNSITVSRNSSNLEENHSSQESAHFENINFQQMTDKFKDVVNLLQRTKSPLSQKIGGAICASFELIKTGMISDEFKGRALECMWQPFFAAGKDDDCSTIYDGSRASMTLGMSRPISRLKKKHEYRISRPTAARVNYGTSKDNSVFVDPSNSHSRPKRNRTSHLDPNVAMNPPKNPKCSFCKGEHHKKSNCEKLQSYGEIVQGIDHFKELVRKVVPIGPSLKDERKAPSDVLKQCKHIIIHSIHQKNVNDSHVQNWNLCELNLLITGIDIDGNPIQSFAKMFICAEEFFGFVKHARKEWLTITNIAQDGTGEGFRCRHNSQLFVPQYHQSTDSHQPTHSDLIEGNQFLTSHQHTFNPYFNGQYQSRMSNFPVWNNRNYSQFNSNQNRYHSHEAHPSSSFPEEDEQMPSDRNDEG